MIIRDEEGKVLIDAEEEGEDEGIRNNKGRKARAYIHNQPKNPEP